MPKHIADAIDHLRRADALPESPHRRAEVHVAIRHLLALAAAEIAAGGALSFSNPTTRP